MYEGSSCGEYGLCRAGATKHLRQAYPQASLIGSDAGYFAPGFQTLEDDTEEDS